MTRILQLKAVLRGIRPLIWRRFLVEDSISFEDLHRIIQTVMGWDNYHLYEFNIGNEAISCEEEGFNAAEAGFKKLSASPEFRKMLKQLDPTKGPVTLDVNKMNKILKDMKKTKPKYDTAAQINKLITSEQQKFGYTYDFGDSWRHVITVENIFEPESGKAYPICVDGERSCPPEDCGGVSGYEELLKIKKDKNHPEYEEKIVDWLGEDFDPKEFNTEEVNRKLNRKRK